VSFPTHTPLVVATAENVTPFFCAGLV
jgi:hypothetical protein